MSLRSLPGRGVRHRYNHHQKDPQDDSSTTTSTTAASSSYESKRIEIVKAVQASLKELYAAGYTRSRATGAIVRLLQRQVGGGSFSSALLSSSGTAHVAAGPSPSEVDLVRIMRQHQMTDGSAMRVLVVSQWIEQRAKEYQNGKRRSRSQNQSDESAVLRAMDDLVRVVRDAPRTILSSMHSPSQKPGSVSRAPKEANAAAAPVRASVLSPTKPAPDGGAPTKLAPLSASAVASATRSISTSTKLDGTTNRRRKSLRGAAGRSSSPALVATASPPRARSDSDVEAERTVSSKVLSSHPRAAAGGAESSSSSAAVAGEAGGTIASPAGSRKRSRTSSGGGDADSPTIAKAPLPSPAPTARSSVSCANGGGGGGKRTRTRR